MQGIIDLSISTRRCPCCEAAPLIRIEVEDDELIPGGDLFYCDECDITFLGANIRRAMPLGED